VAYGLGERVVLGHSLVELLDQLGDRAPALARLRDGGGLLDQYYVTTRYPNSLPGGAPFEAFDRRQAEEAIARAAEFVDAARERIGASD
jgi:HEPN domain-containing protein